MAEPHHTKYNKLPLHTIQMRQEITKTDLHTPRQCKHNRYISSMNYRSHNKEEVEMGFAMNPSRSSGLEQQGEKVKALWSMADHECGS